MLMAIKGLNIMSIKQINKVFHDTNLKGNEKLLMLALADNTNDSGVCFPSWNSLITKTCMSKGSISKWLKIMEDKNILFRVSRNRKNGSRTSNKYLIYPYQNKPYMDEEDYLIFEHLFIQSSEVEPYTRVQKLNRGSSEVEPSTGGQSSEVEHLEPSLNFNHHSKPSLIKKKSNELDLILIEQHKLKDNIIEFIQHREDIKKPFTQLAFTKFLNKLNKIIYDGFDIVDILDNSILAGYTDIYKPKYAPQQKQSNKPKEKTLDEVLNIYIHQRKIHTNKDYTFAKCKEMLHWNLHKEFTKLSTSFEEEMMLAYGYDWVNGKIDFNDENVIELESK